ncbi:MULTISPECIES: hypothetical protein [unclassified Synechocystis]|uniref:hypothetical protein n=1 Tax=unclassified Synechocystis TaxID=2640012 RepID=UPI0004D106EA|nr:MULTISPECIES: hypothetical protein [unclassified Synechocystis]AIE74605.1 hypothetical protein D082_20770 [Synechocystis sp. PCC 6714]
MFSRQRMRIKFIFYNLIFILFQADSVYAWEKSLQNEIEIDSNWRIKTIDNGSIGRFSDYSPMEEKFFSNLDNWQYQQNLIRLHSKFESTNSENSGLESVTQAILINKNKQKNLEDYGADSSLIAELDQLLLVDEQVKSPKDNDNCNNPTANIKPSTNLWSLTDKYLTISPISWHIDYTEPDVNNFPFGVGAAYDFEIINPNYGFLNSLIEDSVVSLEFNIFRDSDFGYPSAYAGLSLRKNIFASPIQIGSGMGLLYTTQLQELSGSPVLPFMLPFIQTDFDSPVNLRVVYIPSFADYNSQQFFFTLLIKIN